MPQPRAGTYPESERERERARESERERARAREREREREKTVMEWFLSLSLSLSLFLSLSFPLSSSCFCLPQLRARTQARTHAHMHARTSAHYRSLTCSTWFSGARRHTTTSVAPVAARRTVKCTCAPTSIHGVPHPCGVSYDRLCTWSCCTEVSQPTES